MDASCALVRHLYGKSGIRLIKVEHRGAFDEVKDIEVDIEVFGSFEGAFRNGENDLILPTDTMKNTVYALARRQPVGEIEDFSLRLANHFLHRNLHFSGVHIAISETLWERTSADGSPQACSFRQCGPERRTACVEMNRNGQSVRAGIRGLPALKTKKSSFEQFLRDEYTTLPETVDRLLRTEIAAEWTYSRDDLDFGALWHAVRAALLGTFSSHESRSVQHTAYAVGRELLALFEGIRDVHISLPNRHCLLLDLSPFGLDNPNELFVPMDSPTGIIEVTLCRPCAPRRPEDQLLATSAETGFAV